MKRGVGLFGHTIQVYHVEIDYGTTDVYVSYDGYSALHEDHLRCVAA